MDDNEQRPDYHATVTIQLGELVDGGVFDWEKVGWKQHAYSDAQYERVCESFMQRFWLEEISTLPVGQWLKLCSYAFRNLSIKYNPLYAQLENGDFDPLQNGGEYAKERKINSKFPETLLTESQDYASDGFDYVRESVGRGNLADDISNYADKVSSIDDMMLDEIEGMLFCCLYTTNVNGW